MTNVILNLSLKAQNFYENSRVKSISSGYERNVLVREDAENCLFVDSNYDLQPGDFIFRCKTINYATSIGLSKCLPVLPDVPGLMEIALKGKFSKEEWKIVLDIMNGYLHSPELDPREAISAELDDHPDVSKKIKSLDKTDGYALLWAISTFWDGRYQLHEFIEQYL